MIADLVSFNKKRDREVSGIKRRDLILQRRLACERAKTADNELVKLTKLEEKFAEVYTLLRLPGKGGKVVQVLVPPDTLNLIDIMINDDNLKNETYFFQTEGGKLPYRSAEALNKFAKDFELENKPLFRSTKLRKYMATAAQFLNLPQHQRTWVADFLGHDLRVHDKYYRMHTDAVNLAKVTKLLYMVDSGKLEDAYSRDLDTIQPTLDDGELDDSVSFLVFENISPDYIKKLVLICTIAIKKIPHGSRKNLLKNQKPFETTCWTSILVILSIIIITTSKTPCILLLL